MSHIEQRAELRVLALEPGELERVQTELQYELSSFAEPPAWALAAVLGLRRGCDLVEWTHADGSLARVCVGNVLGQASELSGLLTRERTQARKLWRRDVGTGCCAA